VSEARPCNVPKFDELAVEKMVVFLKSNEEFMSYFPARLPKGRTIARDYFWNILNSLEAEYVSYIVKHAN